MDRPLSESLFLLDSHSRSDKMTLTLSFSPFNHPPKIKKREMNIDEQQEPRVATESGLSSSQASPSFRHAELDILELYNEK
jgi:hypothetical protein